MYWAPGASHGPHQVMKEWADKYKGKFDDGWDKYRERVFARAKAKGWIPQNAQLTPRPASMASWDSIPEDEKPFQRRLMEVFAGFTEHADYNAGRVIDEIERQGKLDNTLIFYIWGDNGSSAEGPERHHQRAARAERDSDQDLATPRGAEGTRRPRCARRPKTDNMYHAGWAWAGSTPYKGTKLVGAHFGGTRQPMAVSWPKRIKADPTPRPQFHHVIDIVPTIYELTKITPPQVVNGFEQDSIDGVSMVYTFADAKAAGQRKTQFFDIMASRGIYHDGWFASALGPREPWVGGMPKGVKEWSPLTDKWELYNLNEDWSQANDLAAANAGETCGDEGPLPDRIHEEQEPADWRRLVVHRDVPSGGRARLVPHRMDLRWPHDPDAGIRRAQTGQGRQHCDHGCGRARERQRRALRAGAASPAASPAT